MIYQLIEILGISLAEVARQVGVSTFAISEALDRKMKNQFNSVNNVPQFSPGTVRTSFRLAARKI